MKRDLRKQSHTESQRYQAANRASRNRRVRFAEVGEVASPASDLAAVTLTSDSPSLAISDFRLLTGTAPETAPTAATNPHSFTWSAGNHAIVKKEGDDWVLKMVAGSGSGGSGSAWRMAAAEISTDALITSDSTQAITNFRSSGSQPSTLPTSATNPHNLSGEIGETVILAEIGSDWVILAVISQNDGVTLFGLVFSTVSGATGWNNANQEYTPAQSVTFTPLDTSSIPWTLGTERSDGIWPGEEDIVGTTAMPTLIKYEMQNGVPIITQQDACCPSQS